MPLIGSAVGRSIHRQRGVTLVPVVISVFIFSMLITQVIIPLQNRNLRESTVQATANTAEQIIQAALAFRADPNNNNTWPRYIDDQGSDDIPSNDAIDLVPRYLPVFANQNAWGGDWQLISAAIDPSSTTVNQGTGLLLVTETNSNRNARALLQKIGPSAAICVLNYPDAPTDGDSSLVVEPTCEIDKELGTAVKIAIVAPVSNYVESLTVGHLSAGKIEENSQILINRVVESIPPVQVDTTMTTFKNLTVSGQATINTLVVDNLITSSSYQHNLRGSSLRYKDNIQLLDTDFEHIFALQPVSFVYKPAFQSYSKPTGGNRQIGLIAEDVQKVIPELVIYQEGQPVNVDYEKLSVMVLKAVQGLQQDIDNLQTENRQLQEQLRALEAML